MKGDLQAVTVPGLNPTGDNNREVVQTLEVV